MADGMDPVDVKAMSAEDRAAERAANSARRSAEITTKQECAQVQKILKFRPHLGHIILQHLKNLGLDKVPEEEESIISPSKLKTYLQSKKEKREQDREPDTELDPTSLASECHGFPRPELGADYIPRQYLVLNGLSVKLLKEIVSVLEPGTFSMANLNKMVQGCSAEDNRQQLLRAIECMTGENGDFPFRGPFRSKSNMLMYFQFLNKMRCRPCRDAGTPINYLSEDVGTYLFMVDGSKLYVKHRCLNVRKEVDMKQFTCDLSRDSLAIDFNWSEQRAVLREKNNPVGAFITLPQLFGEELRKRDVSIRGALVEFVQRRFGDSGTASAPTAAPPPPPAEDVPVPKKRKMMKRSRTKEELPVKEDIENTLPPADPFPSAPRDIKREMEEMAAGVERVKNMKGAALRRKFSRCVPRAEKDKNMDVDESNKKF